MRESRLEIKISAKLKEDFKALCKESDIDMSDKVREMIANLVRNYKRQAGKVEKTDAN